MLHLAGWTLQQAAAGPLHQAAAFEGRAELYLRAALPLLERRARVCPMAAAAGGAGPGPEEAAQLREEACRLLAGLLRRRGRLEEASSPQTPPTNRD